MKAYSGLSPKRSQWTPRLCGGLSGAALILALAAGLLRGDQIEMQNGDRYAGTVVSLNPSNVVLRSSVLGKVTLPRSEVANIIFATAGRSNAVLSRAGSTNGLPRSSVQTGVKSKSELADLLRQLNGDTNSTSEVQQQILGGAGPEATQKYRQMLRDLSSGKMTLNDLRAQAKAAADQARSQRGDANGELGAMLDSYLSVLDDFVRETAPDEGGATNKPAK